MSIKMLEITKRKETTTASISHVNCALFTCELFIAEWCCGSKDSQIFVIFANVMYLQRCQAFYARKSIRGKTSTCESAIYQHQTLQTFQVRKGIGFNCM